MSDNVIPFPRLQPPDPACYRIEREVGEEEGIVVRVLRNAGAPYDLLVTLHGTFEGVSTVAIIPGEELAVAEAVATAVMTALEAAEITWSLRRG